jgi:hypothetical protein
MPPLNRLRQSAQHSIVSMMNVVIVGERDTTSTTTMAQCYQASVELVMNENHRGQCSGVVLIDCFIEEGETHKMMELKDRTNTLETIETCDSSIADRDDDDASERNDHAPQEINDWENAKKEDKGTGCSEGDDDDDDSEPWDYSDVSFDVGDDNDFFLDETEFSQGLAGYADDGNGVDTDYDFYGNNNIVQCGGRGILLSHAALARKDFSIARIPPSIAEVGSFDSC